MKSRNKKGRLARIVFFAPVIIIIGLVVYGYFQVTAPGTLVVQAIAQDKYFPQPDTPVMLEAAVTINSQDATTPASLSESASVYQVTFGSLQWYTTPAPKTVSVTNQLTVYAIGLYDVIPSAIEVTQSGFNSSKVTAEHGVTPVIWINPTDAVVQLTITGMGQETIVGGANITTIFQNAGNFDYTLSTGSNANDSGIVSVQ